MNMSTSESAPESTSTSESTSESTPEAEIRRLITAAAQEVGIPSMAEFQILGLLEVLFRKQDTFILAPTASGKSLCFHLIPRVLRAMGSSKAVVVVIAPLVGLVEDQIARLSSWKETALRLSSWTSEATSFLFACPEDLTKGNVAKLQDLYLQGRIAAFVVDEAHCALNWGDSFREGFAALMRKLAIFKGIPRMALTATASPGNIEKMGNYLGMRNLRVVSQLESTQNIFLEVRQFKDRVHFVHSLIQELLEMKNKAPKTIIYFREREEVADLWAFFRNELNEHQGLFAMYHSITPERVKKAVALDFKKPKSQIRTLIATNAFGLGVECSGIRRVVHMDTPFALDDYVQQIGRAGRDNKLAAAILFPNKNSRSDSLMKEYISHGFCRRKYVEDVYGFKQNASTLNHCCDFCEK